MSITTSKRWALGRRLTLGEDEAPVAVELTVNSDNGDPVTAVVDGGTTTLLFARYGWTVFWPSFRRFALTWGLSVGGGMSVWAVLSIATSFIDAGPSSLNAAVTLGLVTAAGTIACVALHYRPRRLHIIHDADMAATFRFLHTTVGPPDFGGEPEDQPVPWQQWWLSSTACFMAAAVGRDVPDGTTAGRLAEARDSAVRHPGTTDTE